MEFPRSGPDRSPDPGDRPVMVGRAPELVRLTEFADRAVEHGAHFVFVEGEAGIGKSTLIDHATSDLADARWAVHVGHCIEYADRTLAFDAVVGIIRSVIDRAASDSDDQTVDDLIGHHRADLSSLLPELRADGVDSASLSGDVDRLNDAISNVLIRASNRRPMVVVVEDVHWADAATRDLLASLVHSLGSARILFLISERTGAVSRGHAYHTWLAELRRFANVDTISLSGLDHDALAQQSANILGDPLEPDEVAALAERTGGNAYFATELLVARRDGNAALPRSLAEFLTSRIRRLGPEEQHVMRALAVAGRPLHHRVLAELLPDIDVGGVLRRLFEASVITADGQEIGFGHDLMREAIVPDVLPFEAEDVHRRLAEAMAERLGSSPTPPELATIAAHWSAANESERAMASAIDAAQAAAGVAAFETAAEFALGALGYWEAVDEPERVAGMNRDELVISASDWLVGSHQLAAAFDLLSTSVATASAARSPGMRALLMAKQAPIRFEMGRPGDAEKLIREAVALVGDEVSAEAAQVHHRAAKLAALSASIHPALDAAERAISIAEATGPEIVLVEAMTTKALALGVTESLEAGIDLVHEARRRARDQNMVSQVAFSYRTETHIINFRLGRTDRGLDALRQGLDYAEQHCGPSLRLDLRHQLALGLVEAGRLREAAPILEEALAVPASGLRRLVVLQAAALHRLLSGDLDAAAEFVSAAKDLSDRFHSAQETGFQHRIAAELARREGRFDDAISTIDKALDLQIGSDNVTFTRESILEKCRLVRTLVRADDPRAAPLRKEVEPLVARMSEADPGTAAWSDLMRLELRASDGRASALEATAVLDRLSLYGFGAETLQARLLHAELAAEEARDPADVVDLLVELRELGTNSGMHWLLDGADRITETLGLAIDLTHDRGTDDDRAGGGSSDTDKSGPPDDHGLTSREIEVLELLAQGLTNKEIGTELYVSHRTISTHVSNLLAKLHLKNRSEAASAYHRLGFARSES